MKTWIAAVALLTMPFMSGCCCCECAHKFFCRPCLFGPCGDCGGCGGCGYGGYGAYYGGAPGGPVGAIAPGTVAPPTVGPAMPVAAPIEKINGGGAATVPTRVLR